VTGWAFMAIGTPVAQGSKRHVGNGVMVESSKALKPWRDSVVSAGFGAGPCLSGPVAVRMIFTLPRPRSARKVDERPSKKPDVGKLARAVEDSITSAGLWIDDAQVVDYFRLAKVWKGHDSEALPVPGVLVAAVEILPGRDTALELFDHARLTLKRAWSIAEGITA
jgi:Holliday junction resolvase RusA-like endonuclease